MNFIKKHAFHIITIPTIVAAYLFLGYFLWTSFYPYKILEIKENPIVLNTPLRKGDPLEYSVNYCKYMNIRGVAYRELVDGIIYTLNGTTSNIPVGCHTTVMNLGHVPNVPSGEYSIRIKVLYKINDFRTIEYVYESDKFEIQ